jgi:hypothetical protein
MYALWKKLYLGTIIAGLLLAAGCRTAPTPTAVPTGRLEGIISDASTGAPVAGAQVTIAGQVGVFTMATDAAGAYRVADLPAGPYLVSVQATGYYVNANQVGVVAEVVSSGNVALEPDVVAIVVATPSARAVPTPTPVPTPTASATATTPPSATPTPTVVASPSAIATPCTTPVPTRRPTTKSRPRPSHAAPALLEPRDGSVFTGPRRITFRWTGACCLAADEYFVVSIPHPRGVEEAWVKGTAWQAPDYLYLLVPESRRLTWNVSVRRHTGQHTNGQWKGPIVSPLSETWHFLWYTGRDKPDSPLPTPASPLPPPRRSTE